MRGMQTVRLITLLSIMTLLTAACGDTAGPISPSAVSPPTRPALTTAVASATTIAAATPTMPAAAGGEIKPNDATQARLRVAQCVYGAPDMDVYIDGKVPVVAGIPLAHVGFRPTRYEYLAPGTHTVAVAPTGQGLGQALLAPLDVPVVAGHRYTVVVLGNKEDASHKALVIDDTAALQAIGAKPTDLVDISVNNLKGVKALDYTLSGVLRQSAVPYGGFKAAIWPAAWTAGDTVSVSGAPDQVLVKEGDTYFHTPGMDLLDCWGGRYPGAIGTDYDNIEPVATSALNIIDFLQGFTDASARNGGQTPSFQTFLTAAKAAGLTDLLTRSGPYLVFAPMDTAFTTALPPTRRAVRAEVLADPKARADLLRRYIVEGYYPSFTLVTGEYKGYTDRTVTNLLGEQLVLYSSDHLTINGDWSGSTANVMLANGTRVFYDISSIPLPAPK